MPSPEDTVLEVRRAAAELARLADSALTVGDRGRCVALVEEIYRTYGLCWGAEVAKGERH